MTIIGRTHTIEERKSFGLEPTVSHVEVVRWTVFGITILKIEHII